VKAAKLVEIHAAIRRGLELVQKMLEFIPIGPFGGDETFEINDHGTVANGVE